MAENIRVSWRGESVKRAVSSHKTKALKQGAEFMLEEANKTVPIEEGTLGRSGGTDVDGDVASVYYDTKYARRQHEETRYSHDPGRRAKWLELTFREQRDKLMRFLQTEIKKAFR